MCFLSCLFPPRLLHLHQVRAAVVGGTWVVRVEVIRRLHSPGTLTDVVKRFIMCGTVPIGTHTGTKLLLVLRILIPRFVARREINRILLCHIALCASAGIIIMPQVTPLVRLPRLVLLVLVVMPLLLWLLLEVGRIRMMTSSHSLDDS